MSSNVTILFPDEDHTLGNYVRMQLLKDQEVIFAAYKVPHPLVKSVEVRVQTLGTPCVDTVNFALEEIIKDIDEFERAFKQSQV